MTIDPTAILLTFDIHVEKQQNEFPKQDALEFRLQGTKINGENEASC